MIFLQCAPFKLSGETLEQNFTPATFLNVSWCGTKVALCMMYYIWRIVVPQISNGEVAVTGDSATVEFTRKGPMKRYRCQLDTQEVFALSIMHY